MSDINALYERNAEFANRFQFSELGWKPELFTVVSTCLDARIDPAHFMGLGLGDALVMRNIGGRVTDEIEHELAFISISDHRVAFEDDIVRLRKSERVPNELAVSAHSYDPKSGQLEQVIAPAPLVSEGSPSC